MEAFKCSYYNLKNRTLTYISTFLYLFLRAILSILWLRLLTGKKNQKQLNAAMGNLLMKATAENAKKNMSMNSTMPWYFHDRVMYKDNLHWFIRISYPISSLSFWRIWLYHELKYGSLEEALNIYFMGYEILSQFKNPFPSHNKKVGSTLMSLVGTCSFFCFYHMC